MRDQTAWDYLAIFITIAALAVGLISMAVGRISAWREQDARPVRRRRRQATQPTRRARPPLPTWRVMSRPPARPDVLFPIVWEQRSDAAEQPTEPMGTEDGNSVPAAWEQLGTLPDDVILDILARATLPDGSYRYAESRIAKFVGGRVEDRIAQVRAVRGTPPPPKPSPIDPRFPHRTPEQDALRAALQLKQKGALN